MVTQTQVHTIINRLLVKVKARIIPITLVVHVVNLAIVMTTAVVVLIQGVLGAIAVLPQVTVLHLRAEAVVEVEVHQAVGAENAQEGQGNLGIEW